MPTLSEELRDELVAIMAARQELSQDHEVHLAEQFLERLDQEIDARIAARLPTVKKNKINPTEILGVAFGVGIPLSAIGAWGANFAGLVFVWVAIGLTTIFVTLASSQ